MQLYVCIPNGFPIFRLEIAHEFLFKSQIVCGSNSTEKYIVYNHSSQYFSDDDKVVVGDPVDVGQNNNCSSFENIPIKEIALVSGAVNEDENKELIENDEKESEITIGANLSLSTMPMNELQCLTNKPSKLEKVIHPTSDHSFTAAVVDMCKDDIVVEREHENISDINGNTDVIYNEHSLDKPCDGRVSIDISTDVNRSFKKLEEIFVTCGKIPSIISQELKSEENGKSMVGDEDGRNKKVSFTIMNSHGIYEQNKNARLNHLMHEILGISFEEHMQMMMEKKTNVELSSNPYSSSDIILPQRNAKKRHKISKDSVNCSSFQQNMNDNEQENHHSKKMMLDNQEVSHILREKRKREAISPPLLTITNRNAHIPISMEPRMKRRKLNDSKVEKKAISHFGIIEKQDIEPCIETKDSDKKTEIVSQSSTICMPLPMIARKSTKDRNMCDDDSSAAMDAIKITSVMYLILSCFTHCICLMLEINESQFQNY